IFTSGSTGRPKGVMVQHRGLVNYLCWAVEAYGIRPGSRSLVYSSIAFDLTVTSVFAPLMVGGSITLVAEEQGISALAEALGQSGSFDLVKITPAHLKLLNQALPHESELGGETALVVGGEALHATDLVSWRRHARKARIFNEYGPTETVVGCAFYEVSDTE